MKKHIVTFMLCFVLAPLIGAVSWAQEIQLGGQPVGISIETGGIIVAGISEISTENGKKTPAQDAGIKAGDYIISLNGEDIPCVEDFVNAVESSGGEALTLKLRRGGCEKEVCVSPQKSSDGQWMLGLWLKDGISGIGTVTFYDEKTGIFGALGHCIGIENDSSAVDIRSGEITRAQIISVTPGCAGDPGELNGCADTADVLGSVETNTAVGIFGISSTALGNRTIETGEMSVGEATIITTVSGSESREYSINIDRLYKQISGTYAMLTVTDDDLLSITGGIVQGMSGSPIIQNGRLVGAVTHVFVSDSSKGYGVSINDMLKASGLSA